MYRIKIYHKVPLTEDVKKTAAGPSPTLRHHTEFVVNNWTFENGILTILDKDDVTKRTIILSSSDFVDII